MFQVHVFMHVLSIFTDNGTIDFDEFLIMMNGQLNGQPQTDEDLMVAFRSEFFSTF